MAYKKSSPPDTSKTDETIINLSEAFSTFIAEYEKAAKGNKSAAIRARTISSAIGKGLKMFRKETMEFWK